ncbi:MAG: AAC(3) family N-acetyltransferase [Trebonia sp.]|jgi:aminoglycoside 3-N-acetyltransferase
MVEDHRVPTIGPRGLSLEDLAAELRALGVRAGQTLLVHASLASLGWVDGGAATVVAALRAAVGAAGNVVVFTGTEENSTTSRAHLARIAGLNPGQVAQFRNRMAAFDRERTPTGSGRIAEELRTTEGAVRSDHPQASFAALGPRAAELMGGHALNCHHGRRSPLGRMYALAADGQLDAAVLMLGVSYHACTALHLAEYRYPVGRPSRYPAARTYSCVTSVGGRRRWTLYRDAALDDSDFEKIGEHLDKEIAEHQGYVGEAPSRLLPFRAVVDHATNWMREYRS